MRLRFRIAWVVVGSIIAAATVHVAQPHSTTGGAVLLAAGVVLGELLVLRLDDGALTTVTLDEFSVLRKV